MFKECNHHKLIGKFQAQRWGILGSRLLLLRCHSGQWMLDVESKARLCKMDRSCNFSHRDSQHTAAMAENGDESAKLWKVNRTIHELVNDRVSTLLS